MQTDTEYLVITVENALPGRDEALPVPAQHFVNGHPLEGPFAEGLQIAMFGMGCFWGVEKLFWLQNGVYSTAVGYAAGVTANPHYKEVCSGQTGHNEVVRIVFDPLQISYLALLYLFWEGHDPTQGMRQGNDRGTQYRSGIYCYDVAQQQLAEKTRQQFQDKLTAASYAAISTEIIKAPIFYFAEDYHQQYLAKNPAGYCGRGGTGIEFSP
jgi:peptide-methionine (S)-S-oxide reductase